MPSVGEGLGRAVFLDFPEFDLTHPAQRAGAVDNFDQRVNGLTGGPEPIQLDSSGLDDLFYDSIYGLRNFALDARQNFGIDVTQAPDPRNPLSREAVSLYKQALEQHAKNRERVVQAKQLQDIIIKGVADGSLTANSDFVNNREGLLTPQQFQKNITAGAPDFLNDARNNLIRALPTSQEDMVSLINYRAGIVDDIQQMVSDGRVEQETANQWIASLPQVRGFDAGRANLEDELTKAKIGKERADASNKRQQARLNRRKADEELNPSFPLLTSVARALDQNNAPKSLALGAPERVGEGTLDNNVITGLKLFGQDGFMGQSLHQDGDEIVATFRRDPDASVSQDFFDDLDGTRKKFSGKETVKHVGAGKFEVRFTRDNFVPLLYAVYGPTSAETQIKKMRDTGVIDNRGRITQESIIRFSNKGGFADPTNANRSSDPLGVRGGFSGLN